jgi:hypothetical protein
MITTQKNDAIYNYKNNISVTLLSVYFRQLVSINQYP